MNFDEASARIGTRAGEARRNAFPIWPERWRVLLESRRRPLWLPPGDYRFQARCVDCFMAPWKAAYARLVLRVQGLVPAVRVLREARLPATVREALSFRVPLGEPWRCAIQFGTPGPYQKASLLFVSAHGKGLAIAKVAMASTADAMVESEAEWLRALAAMPTLAASVPRVMADGATLGGRRYLVATLAPHGGQSRGLTAAHLRFLRALARVRFHIHRFGASPRYDALQSALTDLSRITPPTVHAALASALEACASALQRWAGPFVIAHGDFSRWNIRVDAGRIFVFDWEYAHADANPLFDVLTYLLLPRAASGHGISTRAFGAALREASAVAREVHPEGDWCDAVVAALALAYLIDVIVHYSLANGRVDPADRVVRSCWRLMERRAAWFPA